MRWFFLVSVAAVVWLLRALPGFVLADAGASALVAFGLLTIGGELAGEVAARLRVPRITGYLVLGMAFGPFVLGLVSAPDLDSLRVFEELALGLIALTAGGELQLASLRKRWKLIVGITASHAVGIFLGAAGLFWLILRVFPFLGPLGPAEMAGAATLIGIITVAKSPATTIAVITELKATGSLVDTVLGITVLKDLVILIFFTWVNGIVHGWLGGPGDVSGGVTSLAATVGLSLLAGGGLGLLLGTYLSKIGLHPEITVLAVVLLSLEIAHGSGLEHLLISMAAGFAARNLFPASATGFLRALERSSPPIYVIFFGLIGAGLDIRVFATAWLAVLILFAVRLGLVWGVTGAMARALRADPPIRRWAWMGFVAQAGLSLGLAARVAREFPNFGGALAAVVVGAVVVNQVAGPILWRHALVASGEAG
ncbi:MAG: hypothetical protein GXP48_11655 [Acidobacteria bacterium]|nr:hypothetical protein [Acidobacteriota bacterium]